MGIWEVTPLLAGLVGVCLATSAVTITVSPRVIIADGSLTVTCRVQRSPDNRWLTVGLRGYQESGMQLDGEQARVTYLVPFSHVPCGTTEAFCVVRRTISELRVGQSVLVGGCEP